MGSLTDSGENMVLDYYFGASANTTPANWFIGLSTTTITDSGSNITEPVGNGYARAGGSNNKTTFSNSSAGALSNAVTLTYPTATGSWGTVVDFFLANHATAAASANIWGYGTLAASKTIQSGDTASFAASAISITLT